MNMSPRIAKWQPTWRRCVIPALGPTTSRPVVTSMPSVGLQPLCVPHGFPLGCPPFPTVDPDPSIKLDGVQFYHSPQTGYLWHTGWTCLAWSSCGVPYCLEITWCEYFTTWQTIWLFVVFVRLWALYWCLLLPNPTSGPGTEAGGGQLKRNTKDCF